MNQIPFRHRKLARPTAASTGLVIAAILSFPSATETQANGVFRNGVGARSMSLGGADSTLSDSATAAITANPAALSDFNSIALDLGVTAAFPSGEFTNAANPSGSDLDASGVFPDLAVVFPVTEKFGLGIGISPDTMLTDEWRYVDPPGGLSGTTSYGLVDNQSQILVIRSAFGAGYAITEKLSIGASVGLLYNNNQLNTAYVFQSNPTLAGFKTLVDLDTDGFGVDGEFGVLYRPTTNLHFAVTYKTSSTVKANGTITGNASAELTALGGPFAGVQPDFAYDAEVENTFPQMVTVGAGWQINSEWRVLGQVDWINWSDAFDSLPLHLTNGNNADLNAFLGSNSIDDTVPLNWKDQFVYRAGVEFTPGEHWSFRAGYSFGESPVPSGTLTPLTAAIMEQTVGLGVGYRWGRYHVDAAWQWDLPTTAYVGTADLLDGEYSNSSVEVSVQWVGLTAGMSF